jgi:hypothetical protein
MMSAIPCPNCGRRLKLDDDLRGALVQCPLCATAFEAPQEEPRSVWRPPEPPAPPAPLPLPSRRPPTLAWRDTAPGSETFGARRQAALASAAFWLQITLFVQGLSGLCCCSMPMGPGLDYRSGLIPWIFICKYVPLLFAGVASGRLPVRRSYRLCFAAGIMVLLASVWTMLEMAFMGLSSLGAFGPYRVGNELGLLGCLLALVGVVCGFVGGVKTLSVLSDPQMRRQFH